MGKKLIVIALALFAFGFASALRSNAGTEVIEPYRAPAPTYDYAPAPPRPVLYAPPPPVSVVVVPAYGYYGPRFGGLPTGSMADTLIGVLNTTGGKENL